MTVNLMQWENPSKKGNSWVDYWIDISNILIPEARFEYDYELEQVVMKTSNWDYIWKIYKWTLWLTDSQNVMHNWFEVEEYYRWMGFAKILFNEFDRVFWANDIEYSRKIDIIKFYLKQWYYVSDVIDDSWESLEYFDDEIESIEEYLISWHCIQISRN